MPRLEQNVATSLNKIRRHTTLLPGIHKTGIYNGTAVITAVHMQLSELELFRTLLKDYNRNQDLGQQPTDGHLTRYETVVPIDNVSDPIN